MYTVLGFVAVFHKLIEENWKKISVEISSPLIHSMYIYESFSTPDNEIKIIKINSSKTINFKVKTIIWI